MGGLRGNLIAAIVTATAGLVVTLFLMEDILVEFRKSIGAVRDLGAAIEMGAELLDSGNSEPVVANRIASEHACRARVFDHEGVLVGDSAEELTDDARLSPAELRSITDEPRPIPGPRSLDGVDFLVVRARHGSHVVEAARPTSAIESELSVIREVLLIGGVFVILIAVVLAIVLSRTMNAPLRDLSTVADALARGDLSKRIESNRKDELGSLGRALDDMAERLGRRMQNLRSEEARLRTVLDAMVEAVLVTDHLGQIVMTNRALDELAQRKARGRSAIEVFHSLELDSAIKSARRGTASTANAEIKVGAETRSFAVVAAPLLEEAGVVAVMHDVTSVKRAEQIRRDFVANASHELRTPLTAIRGYAETLQDGAFADNASATRFLSTIVRHAIRLQHIVNDLAVLSKAESPEQRYESEIVDVQSVARDVVHGLESQARKQGIRVTVDLHDDPPYARANERALDQVLVNLVDNAIKYSPQGGRVCVRTLREGDQVVIEVEDTGPGIAPQHRDRVFERFYRVDPGRSRELGGTGLGLAIVKHLVAGMGGKVELRSEVGVGTTFRVLLQPAAVEDDGVDEDDAL